MPRFLLAVVLAVMLAPRAVGAGEVSPTPGVPRVPAAVVAFHLEHSADALGLDAATEEGRRARARLEEAVAEELRDRAIVAEEARRRGLRPSDQAVEARLRELISGMGGLEAARAALFRHGLVEDELRRMVEQEQCGPLLMAELTREVTVSDDELRALYTRAADDPALRSLLVEPEQVEAEHILIEARPSLIARAHTERGLAGAALERAVRTEMEARRRRAEELRRRLVAGSDFPELARRFSDDPSSRGDGGRLGRFARGTHTTAFDAAAFSRPVGRIGPVVQTEYGFHVIRVTARTAERRRSFEEIRADLHARLLARKRTQHLRSWLETRRQEARITDGPSARGQR